MKKREFIGTKIIWMLMVIVLLLTVSACERPLYIEVENKTSQVLIVSVEGVSLGTIKPGEQVKKEFPGTSVEYLVVAKNAQGDTVFSKTFSLKEMEQAKGSDTFKVEIPTKN